MSNKQHNVNRKYDGQILLIDDTYDPTYRSAGCYLSERHDCRALDWSQPTVLLRSTETLAFWVHPAYLESCNLDCRYSGSYVLNKSHNNDSVVGQFTGG